MKADISFGASENGDVNASVHFEGTMAEKLALCQYILTAMGIEADDAMRIAGGMRLVPIKIKGTGTSVSIDKNEYFRQRGKENA